MEEKENVKSGRFYEKRSWFDATKILSFFSSFFIVFDQIRVRFRQKRII